MLGKAEYCVDDPKGGGVYEDKGGTLQRIKKTITEVIPTNVRDRLVLENDEVCRTP